MSAWTADAAERGREGSTPDIARALRSTKGKLRGQRMTCNLENISVQNAWTELWSGSRLSLEAHLVNIWSLQEAALSRRQLGHRDCDFGVFKGGDGDHQLCSLLRPCFLSPMR